MIVTMLKRDKPTAAKVIEALGLPADIQWANVTVSFGTEEPATCQIELLLTPAQLEGVVAAMTPIGGGQ